MTSTASFHPRTSWTWWLDHPWYQNDQYWCFLLDGSSKIQFFTGIWYLFCLRLLRPAYVTFFENWLQISKCHNLRHLKNTLYLSNYQSWYLSEPNYFTHFNMRHPVVLVVQALSEPTKISYILHRQSPNYYRVSSVWTATLSLFDEKKEKGKWRPVPEIGVRIPVMKKLEWLLELQWLP